MSATIVGTVAHGKVPEPVLVHQVISQRPLFSLTDFVSESGEDATAV
jgi:hypothetical protein